MRFKRQCSLITTMVRIFKQAGIGMQAYYAYTHYPHIKTWSHIRKAYINGSGIAKGRPGWNCAWPILVHASYCAHIQRQSEQEPILGRTVSTAACYYKSENSCGKAQKMYLICNVLALACLSAHLSGINIVL